MFDSMFKKKERQFKNHLEEMTLEELLPYMPRVGIQNIPQFEIKAERELVRLDDLSRITIDECILKNLTLQKDVGYVYKVYVYDYNSDTRFSSDGREVHEMSSTLDRDGVEEAKEFIRKRLMFEYSKQQCGHLKEYKIKL